MSLDAYYLERPELAALVPPTARCVLDVGCGEGALGKMLKRDRGNVAVYGIEPSKAAAARAAEVLDGVHVGVLESQLPEGWPTPDCVVFGDVLEHMVDPLQALGLARTHLAADGTLVISLPNVGHWSVLLSALRGRWDYSDSGVMDRTHLRFFTRLTALELIASAGFELVHFKRVLRQPLSFTVRWLFRRFTAGTRKHEARTGLTPPKATPLDLLTYQMLFVAKLPTPQR